MIVGGRPNSIYFRAGEGFNASQYYRILLPVSTMAKMHMPVTLLGDHCTIDLNPLERWQLMANSDIHLHYQAIGSDLLEFMRYSRSWEPVTNKFGELQHPPSFIVDTDDDIFNVDPLNPAFGNLGYKDMEGNELEEDKMIWWRDFATNAPQLLWAPGKNINYAANKAKLDIWRDVLKEAELVTCSTPRSAAYVEREIGPNDKTFVMPNCIAFEEYPKVELAAHPKEIRILWQGSTTHYEDLWNLRGAMSRVAEKYPHTKWIFWGADYRWASQFMPKDRVVFQGWCHYLQYKLRLSIIGHDINLCPLTDSVFNRSRSGIKWYESSAVCNPAATLAQATGPYLDEIQEGETGLLWHSEEEFETKLGALIEDATLRKTLTSNSRDWLRTHRDPTKHATALYERYATIRSLRKTWDRQPYSGPLSPLKEEQNTRAAKRRSQKRDRKKRASVPANQPDASAS